MIMDASAWIEHFRGGELGKRVDEVLGRGNCYTSIVTVAEISNWAKKEGREMETAMKVIKQLSAVIELNENIAILAGRYNFIRKKRSQKWGMMDSFVLATARLYHLRILTKDSDFGDLGDAEILK